MPDNILNTNEPQQAAGDLKQLWRQLSIHSFIRLSIITAAFIFLFNKELGDIVSKWLNDPSWSHGIIIPLFSFYFLNQSKKEVLNCTPRPNYLGLVLLILVILFYIINTISPSGFGYFRQISMIGAMVAVVLFLGGWRFFKITWLPVLFLLFAIPLPEGYLRLATIPMRQWAATISTAMLNLVPNLEAIANGVIINIIYHGKPIEPGLDVAEACSGMRLLMAFFALGVAMAYLHYRPAWQRLVLLASTIPIAILCNIVRVTVTGFIHVLISPKYSQGIYHDLLGMAMLPLAFGLYGLLAWFMSNLMVDEEEDKPSSSQNVVISRRNRN
jgi:exosortase